MCLHMEVQVWAELCNFKWTPQWRQLDFDMFINMAPNILSPSAGTVCSNKTMWANVALSSALNSLSPHQSDYAICCHQCDLINLFLMKADAISDKRGIVKTWHYKGSDWSVKDRGKSPVSQRCSNMVMWPPVPLLSPSAYISTLMIKKLCPWNCYATLLLLSQQALSLSKWQWASLQHKEKCY